MQGLVQSAISLERWLTHRPGYKHVLHGLISVCNATATKCYSVYALCTVDVHSNAYMSHTSCDNIMSCVWFCTCTCPPFAMTISMRLGRLKCVHA